MTASLLIIACGALAREIKLLRRTHGWQFMDLHCLPADLHNTPEHIPAAVRQVIETNRGCYAQIIVAYADCGTGGLLDKVLEETGTERLPGAHCYAFYAGQTAFAALAEAEPGRFYLTDFLVRHFQRLVVEGLKLDTHPALKPMMFGHYKEVVYLSQSPNDELLVAAKAAAQYLGLSFQHIPCGYGELLTYLDNQYHQLQRIEVQSHG